MAVQDTIKLTVEAFDRLALLPENADRILEYVGGEVFDVPSNAYVSEIALTIAFFLQLFIRQHAIRGHITGEAGGYMVSGERYAPDVAFISFARQPELAVEVVSPDDPERRLTIKIANYLAAGTLVWMVRPDDKLVEVYVPGQPVKILGIKDTLDGGNVLPGFSLKVSDVFKPLSDTKD